MGKTRNGHLVKNQHAEDEFCLDDYLYHKKGEYDFWEPNDYVESYSVDQADAEYARSIEIVANKPTAKNQMQDKPKVWDGIMRKDEKCLPKVYKHVPSLCTLAVDALPMRVRVELPKYYPGSIDYLYDN
jgi:hypothetical protein